MGKKRGDDERISEAETQLADHEARIRALEDAARAFAVVYAIPRITDKTGGD